MFESHRACAEFAGRSAGPQPKLTLSVLEFRVSHGGRWVSSGLVGLGLGVVGRGAWKEEKRRRRRGTGEKGGLGGCTQRGEEKQLTGGARRRLPTTACMAGGGGEEQGKQSTGRQSTGGGRRRKRRERGVGISRVNAPLKCETRIFIVLGYQIVCLLGWKTLI